MQYISPLHFLESSAAGSAIDKKDLLLAKKKLLAELELNDGKGIVINGKERTKNDIVRFFDDLQQTADLSYHTAIYQDKVLLKFLEYNALEKKDRFADNPLYADEVFIEWIGPFYVNSFVSFARECFLHFMVDEWATLMDNPLMMTSYQKETAWQDLEKDMRSDIEQLSFFGNKKMSRSDLVSVESICDFRHIQMLFRLPADRFGALRDELAFAIMQLCISVFNHVDRDWARNTIENAHVLAVSEDLKKQVYNKKYEMDNIVAGSTGGGSTSGNWWTYVRIALFVIFIIIRVSGACSRSSNSYNYNYKPPASIYVHSSSGDSISLQTLQERMQQIEERKEAKQLTDSEARKALQNIMKQQGPPKY
ncbi:MAG TPA: hypothetical protein VLD19_21550 [Chitinophagaceae bacterium]|nr:hypothetical protein [Chitinophagaceae bacterium]